MSVRKFSCKKIAPAAAWICCAGVFLGCVYRAGGSAAGAVLSALFLFSAVALPGCSLARLAKLGRYGLFCSGSAVFGTALFALTAAAASALHLPALMWVLPVYGVFSAVYHRRKAVRTVPLRHSAAFSGAAVWVIPALLLLAAFLCVLSRTKPLDGAPVMPDHDFLWNMGNLESFLQGFPPRDLRFSGQTLTYHWLTELLGAGLCMALPVSAWDVLAMFLPAAVACSLPPVLTELGALWFENSRRQTAVLMFLLFFCGELSLWKVFDGGRTLFWNTFFRHMLTNINGVGTCTLMLACCTAGFAVLWRGCRSIGTYAFSFAAFVLLALAKGPVAAVVLIALILAALFRFAFDFAKTSSHEARRRSGAVVLFAAVLGCAFLIIYHFLFSAGTGSSVRFSLHATLEKSWFGNILAALHIRNPVLWQWSAPLFWILQTVLFAPAAAPLAVAGLLHDAVHLTKLSGEKLFAAAMSAGGFLAFYLFDHESMSQIYFAFAGFFFLCLLAAGYLPGLFRRVRAWKKPLRAAVLSVLGAFAAAACVSCVCSDVYFAARAVQPVQNEAYLPLTSAQSQAADALRQLGPQDVFVTNRIHTGRHLEGLSNVYTGLSGRQCYMESFKYAVSNMGVRREEVQLRLDTLHRIFGAESAAQARAAMPEGVRYVLFDRAAARAGWDVLEGDVCIWADAADAPDENGVCYFGKVFENEDTVIYLAL